MMEKKASRKVFIITGALFLVGVLLVSRASKKERVQPETGGESFGQAQEETADSTGASTEASTMSSAESLSRMSSPQAGWKTYKNKKLGFELRYPEDWGLMEKDYGDFWAFSLEKVDPTQKLVEELFPGMNGVLYWISLVIRDNPRNFSAKEAYLETGENRGQTETKLEEVRIGGRLGIKYSKEVKSASGPSTVIMVANKGRIYELAYAALATQETHEKFMDVFEGIIGSFKFVVK